MQQPDYYEMCPNCYSATGLAIYIYASFDVIEETMEISAHGECEKCNFEIDFKNNKED